MLNSIKITDITKTKKGFNALFCDSGFLFSVDDMLLAQEKIEIGSCFTQQELTLLCEKSCTNKAVQKAYNILSFRSHSRKELFDKLCKNFDRECANAACDKMENLGLINDEEYCKAKAEYLINTKMCYFVSFLHIFVLLCYKNVYKLDKKRPLCYHIHIIYIEERTSSDYDVIQKHNIKYFS